MSSEQASFRLISPDVKLGDRVRIFSFTNLHGCEIGNSCKISSAMIGAGSVVTKNVPPRAVVAGNPARILRCLPDKS